MKKSNIQLVVMQDGNDAVIILKNFAKDEEAIKTLYERAGKIADTLLMDAVEAEPSAPIPDIDTSEIVIPEGNYAGKKPIELTEELKDKGYKALSGLVNRRFDDSRVNLAIKREMTRYIKWRFGNIQDAAKYANALSDGQCNAFLVMFDAALTDIQKDDIARKVGFISYDDAMDFASEQDKKLIIQMMINTWK